MPLLRRSTPLGIVLALLATGGWTDVARAGSKRVVAALGQQAPGGGVFAGPSITGWPAAAGSGWIAFRVKVTDGSTTEAIVVAHMTAPQTRIEVASLRDPTPLDAAGNDTGTFRQFLGRPAVNTNGDVAFVALVDPAVKQLPGTGPTPAGVFLFRRTPPQGEDQLVTLALSGQAVASGLLDLASPVDPNVESGSVDVQERAPALDDQRNVAFLSAIAGGPSTVGAIFLKPAAGDLRAVVSIGDPFEDQTFSSLGPPAMNNVGAMAFHALLDGGGPDSPQEALFIHDGTAPTMFVRDGVPVHGSDLVPPDQLLTSFGNLLTMNDAGDVAFTAGPLTGPSEFRCRSGPRLGQSCGGVDARCDSSPGAGDGHCDEVTPTALDDPSPGVLVYHEHTVTLLAHPGKRLPPNRVTSVVLGSAAGSQVPVPAVDPDGGVVYFASLNGGSSEAIVRVDPENGYKTPQSLLLLLGGGSPDPSPVGGHFLLTLSAPAVDATGGLALLARVSGGRVSEPLVYLPTTGTASAIVTGDALPTTGGDGGYFAGPPFGAPVLNDRGDIAFRAQVALGQSSVGIFRSPAGGTLEALVRAGDPAPLTGSPVFLDLVGDIGMNGAGTVVFTGVVDGLGRGVYTVGPEGLKPVAVRGDPATGQDVTFSTIGLNPSINRDGNVAFRAAVQYPDPSAPLDDQGNPTAFLKQEGIYLADDTGIHLLAAVGAPWSGAADAPPFFKIRDPELTGLGGAAFRAQLGTDPLALLNGLYVAGLSGVSKVVAQGDDLGSGYTLTEFSGVPTVNSNGDLAFLATRAQGPRLTPSLLRRTESGIDLLGWRGMPGPLGGLLRSFGQPTINNHQHVAFRAAYQAGTGGKGGFVLASDNGLQSLVQVGENTPLDGQFISFGAHGSLNDDDQLAFVATLSRGTSRNAIFTVSPADLTVEALALRLTGVGNDVVRLSAALSPGISTNGLAPDKERVTVALADASGTFWQAAIPSGKLKARGTRFALGNTKSVRRQFAAFALQAEPTGSAAVTLRSAPSDFTGLGTRSLVPPFTVTVEIGDDSATASVNCTVRGSRVRCQ